VTVNLPAKRYRIGIDVGGTFTDVVLVEEQSGEILVAKVATVPDDPSKGCVAGFDKALAQHRVAPQALSFAVHGTTIATNTIIQGKGAKAGLIASEGFRDVLEIAYQTRPTLYDVFFEKPKPLIPRHLCLGVPERMGHDGETIVPLDEAAVRGAARALKQQGVEAVVVAFLHSYRDPSNERRARELILEEFPETAVVLSSDVCPEYREYPRTSTTAVNAVLVPRVSPYVSNLEDRLAARGMVAGLHLMTSSGGIVAADTAKRLPVTLVESGPAAGVIGATYVAVLAGYRNLLALDIGGTTAKAAVVTDGEPTVSDQFEVGVQAVATVTAHRGQGYPVRTPVISLVEIGAGGGSVAYVDPGGALTVGPESVGAVPGPAAYGEGGTRPSLTDANVLLGRIDPNFFLGGEKKLRVDLAEKAIAEHVAARLGMEPAAAASAVIDVANTKMTSALYFISVEQGIDPRDYILVASGGAGPMHAVAIAEELGVGKVLIPPTPGLNSAVGLLATDLRHEQVRTYMRRHDEADPADMDRHFSEMAETMADLLGREGVEPAKRRIIREIDMCYVGQSYALRVPFPDQGGADVIAGAVAAFHQLHQDTYGHCDRDEAVNLMSLRALGLGLVDRPRFRELAGGTGLADRAVKSRRDVYFRETGAPARVPIYDRALLASGDSFEGPAIVEQMDTTTVVPPGARVDVDRFGNLIITTRAA
jgi:N-methylhydantoinase A